MIPIEASPAAMGTFSRRWQLARPLLGAYWLALAAGLSLFALARPDADALGRLWLGAVAGSALGNLLALCNLRLWTALLGVALAAPFALLITGPFVAGPELVTAFLPALVCGFVLLGARSTLVAFWFPAMIFSLTLIDRLDGAETAASLDARATVMLVMVALAFLLLLAMYERRRIALWRVVGNVAHVEGRATILREPVGRGAARAGWSAATVIAAAALTTWIAPRLWRGETLDGNVAIANGGGGVVGGTGLPCCHVAARQSRARVREYLDVAAGVEHAAPRPGIDCAACNALAAAPVFNAATFVPSPTAIVADPPVVAPPAAAMNVAVAAPSLAPIPPIAPTPSIAPSPGVEAATVTPSSMPSSVSAPPEPSRNTFKATTPDNDETLLRWIMTMMLAVAASLLASLLLRPLRRAVTLRHLRRPYWPEPLQQRVSNLWQLALIGLRDAGVRTGERELPEDVARRAAGAEVAACAAILSRARHGLGLDDGDLEAMRAAAEGTFRAARENIGAVGRAVSWMRWPLL